MTYSLQITKSDGRVFAAPDFTPMVLAGIFDVNIKESITNKDYQIDYAYNDGLMVFYYCRDKGRSGFFFHNANVNGKLTLRGRAQKDMTITIYIFDNRVFTGASYGINIYNSNGDLVFNCNSLPLVIKRTTVNTSSRGPNGSFAVASGVSGDQYYQIGPDTSILISECCSCDSDGLVSSPFSSDDNSGGGIGAGAYEYLYIDRTIYDKYRKTAIGY